jgi:hypothetical protein
MTRLVLVALVLAALAGAGHARPCTYYSAYGPAVYNLSSSGFDAKWVAHAQSAGVAGLRVEFRVDTQKSWNAQILGAYDTLLANAYAGGFDVMGLIGPGVVAGAGQSTWNAPPTTVDGRNPYTQMYVDATQVLFQHYGDQIKYWEIWNEPNACSSDYLSVCEQNPQSAGGSFIRADLYAKLLAEVWVQNQAVISAKGLHLVAGGLYAHDVGGNAVVYAADDYMNEVYSNGVWGWFQQHYNRKYPWDAFGYHIYTTLYGPAVSSGTLSSYLDTIAGSRSAHGDASPIWMTEFGWWTPQISEAQQAQDLDTEYSVLEKRSDVGRTFVFRVDEWQGWGVYRSDWTSKPAVAILQSHSKGCTQVALPPLPDLAAGLVDAGASAPDGAQPSGADGPSGADDAGGPGTVGSPDDATVDGTDPGGGCALSDAPAPVGLAPWILLLALGVGRRYRRRS